MNICDLFPAFHLDLDYHQYIHLLITVRMYKIDRVDSPTVWTAASQIHFMILMLYKFIYHDDLCGLHSIMHPWFDFWFWRYIYCLLVCIICFPTYHFFLHFFCLSPPSLIFLLRIDPLHLNGCHKRRLTFFSFFVFILCCSTFFDWWMRAVVVLGLVFSIPSQDTGLGGNVSEMTRCVSSGM